MKTFIVTFHDENGESLGDMEIFARTPSKAKILAATLYTCPWAFQTVIAA